MLSHPKNVVNNFLESSIKFFDDKPVDGDSGTWSAPISGSPG
jgi:hypothetical protein